MGWVNKKSSTTNAKPTKKYKGGNKTKLEKAKEYGIEALKGGPTFGGATVRMLMKFIKENPVSEIEKGPKSPFIMYSKSPKARKK